MTIRTKLLLTLTAVVVLVIVHGFTDSYYASVTRAEIDQLGKVAVAGSSATHDMLDTLSELETSLLADQSPGNTANGLPTQDELLIRQFRTLLNNVKVSFFGMSVVSPKRTRSGQDLQQEQLALLKNIETSLDQVEVQWRDFTNSLSASPEEARSILEKVLLPAINEKLRPAVTRYDQLINEQKDREIQLILQQAQLARRKMVTVVALPALAVLVAALFVARLILGPMKQFAAAANEVAAGNRWHRLQINQTGEFGEMAAAFNHMLDVLQTTTISRDKLEENVRERTAELEKEIAAHQAAKAELDRFFALSHDALSIGNFDGQLLRVNPAFVNLFGYSDNESYPQPIEKGVHPDDVPILQNKWRELANGVAVVDFEIRAHHRDGTWRILAWKAVSVPELKLIYGSARDVSEERQAKEQILKLNLALKQRVENRTAQLQESERRHRTLLANLQGMVYRRRNDREGNMDFVSDGCRTLLGLEPEVLMGGQIAYNDLIHPDDRDHVRGEIQAAIVRRSAFTIEYRFSHADGKWHWAWEQGRAVFDGMGQVTALEGYVTDNTQRLESERVRRALEDQLRQAQKLEAIGTLAGGIAHDFNNILAAILGSAELIKMDLQPDHPSWECLQQIFVAGNRARELVQQILMFSRRKETELSVIRLQPVVRECLKLLRSTIPAMVEIRSFIDPDCAPVLADPTQIHQVIMNLCTNSWQALPERGGWIEVDLKMCEVDEIMAATHPDLHPGSYVQLSVRDNGGGMDKATLERIFEPFFTTKPAGKGSGLGLSMVHGIVKRHNGATTVESKPGEGTLFCIYLPAQAVLETEVPNQTWTVHQGNGECVLLVDDEESSGSTTEKILKRFKYNVERFTHPQEALDRFQLVPGKYNLVISDLAMPAMSGMDFAAAVRRIRSDVPVLLTTGLIDPATEERARQIGIHKVLLKPFTPETIGRDIAEILAENGGI